MALKNVSGVCSDSEQFVEYLNEAMRRLMRRGGFYDTEQLLKICVYNGCITWPRFVGTVLGIRACCMGDMDIRNNWYAIIGPRNCSFRSGYAMRDAGTGPTYNDITGEDGKYIRVYLSKLEDAGKTITLFGIDTNGQPLQEKIDGVWRQGVTLTMAAPYVQTSMLVKAISSVTREVTQALVRVFEFDPATDLMRDIAVYEPSETNPRYRKSHIQNFHCLPSACSTEDGVRYRTIEALVKMEFIPVVSDRDFLAIENYDALKFAISAIKFEEANDDDAASVKWIKAISEMNMELRDKHPGQQTVIRVNPVGRMIRNPI